MWLFAVDSVPPPGLLPSREAEPRDAAKRLLTWASGEGGGQDGPESDGGSQASLQEEECSNLSTWLRMVRRA